MSRSSEDSCPVYGKLREDLFVFPVCNLRAVGSDQLQAVSETHIPQFATTHEHLLKMTPSDIEEKIPIRQPIEHPHKEVIKGRPS